MLTRRRFSSQGSFAYERLRRMILDGEMASGVRIGIREMASELETSTGPVRDALIQLSNEHLVQGGHGLQWSVARMTREMVDGGMIVREGLEAQSARRAAVAATPEDIQRLRHLAEQIDARVEAGLVTDPITAELDMRFHRLVAEVSGSPQLLQEIERWKVVMDWARLCLGGKSRQVERHVKVVDAIASGDPDFAERQMRYHVLHPWEEIKWEMDDASNGERVGDATTGAASSEKT